MAENYFIKLTCRDVTGEQNNKYSCYNAVDHPYP